MLCPPVCTLCCCLMLVLTLHIWAWRNLISLCCTQYTICCMVGMTIKHFELEQISVYEYKLKLILFPKYKYRLLNTSLYCKEPYHHHLPVLDLPDKGGLFIIPLLHINKPVSIHYHRGLVKITHYCLFISDRKPQTEALKWECIVPRCNSSH